MSKPVCIFQAPLWTRSGYGDLGMSLAKSLLRYNKYDLFVVPTRWGGCTRKYLLDGITDLEEKELFTKILRGPLQKQPELFIQCTIPNEFQTPAKYNIGITAGIETTLAKSDWIEGLNRMNLNLVTSQHAKDVFEKPNYTITPKNSATPLPIKSTKPMEVQFWGADTKIYKKTDEKIESVESEMAKIKEDFCFLFVGQWTSGGLFSDRKDIGNLIKTFIKTFANFSDESKRPALVLKTSGAALCNMDRHDMVTRLTSVKSHVETELKTKNLPNVYLLHGELTEVEMNALYNHEKVKAHISFTHGEGYGHPLLLSTLSGKPLLVSNWSGHLDFLDKDMCKLLDGEVKPLPNDCVNEWLIKNSSWFTVNYSKAEDVMKTCFHNYGAYLKRAEELRVRNTEQFSNEAMDRRFHGLLDKYVPQFAVETKLVLPKLKKVEPTVNTGTPPQTPKLVLPKLRKVT